MTNFTQIDHCRICGNTRLERVLDLGDQVLTGVFPRARDGNITRGPLRLVKCIGGDDTCGLLQLEHTYDLNELYGHNYGYRSGLNASMTAHLRGKVERISRQVELSSGDLVIDIGANDGTTLQGYTVPGLTLVGIDPSGEKFREYYPAHIQLIADFFSSDVVTRHLGRRKAKVVTSFAMFYDLEAPMEFMRQVYDVLAEGGVWVFEQSYMPSMLAANAYDTVCHEHLEFYGLSQIKWMADRVGFEIADVEVNDVNGGSFSVVARKVRSVAAASPAVRRLLDAETGLRNVGPYRDFAERVRVSRDQIVQFVDGAKARGQKVAGLGASTKGNVLLQYCGFTESDLFAIGEVNSDKFGCVTPGSWIPIIPEQALLAQAPDYLIVLPWHFRSFFERAEHLRGVQLVFPLPGVSVSGASRNLR